MAKTKPIGVRFDEPLSEEIFEQEGFTTYQGVLTFLENYYMVSKLVNSRNDRDSPFTNAARGKDESGINEDEIKNALNSTETKKEVKANSNFGKHKLWKQGDPKENSMAFSLKYGCSNYTELEQITPNKQ